MDGLPQLPALMTLPSFSNTTAAPIPGATVGLVLLSLAFALGLPGNAFVLWSSTALTRRHSVPALLVTHLALADVATLLTAPVYLRFLSTGRWELGLAACQGCHYICAVAMYASVFLIVLMSLHRCLAVSRPTLALAGHSTRAAHGAVAAAWVMAFLLAVPTITFRKVSGEAPREQCQRAHHSTSWLVFHNLLETVAGGHARREVTLSGYSYSWREKGAPKEICESLTCQGYPTVDINAEHMQCAIRAPCSSEQASPWPFQ
ncbi:leukotriene B4 receptor 1 isoform X3 [Struthio camelus]|uniref:leukotriene B4 receptor 1 isoform X3 n=1 Tax=Struthio camelus TaxID=8801 RepID=UPI0036041C66